MKKLLLILLCLPMIGFGQENGFNFNKTNNYSKSNCYNSNIAKCKNNNTDYIRPNFISLVGQVSTMDWGCLQSGKSQEECTLKKDVIEYHYIDKDGIRYSELDVVDCRWRKEALERLKQKEVTNN